MEGQGQTAVLAVAAGRLVVVAVGALMGALGSSSPGVEVGLKELGGSCLEACKMLTEDLRQQDRAELHSHSADALVVGVGLVGEQGVPVGADRQGSCCCHAGHRMDQLVGLLGEGEGAHSWMRGVQVGVPTEEPEVQVRSEAVVEWGRRIGAAAAGAEVAAVAAEVPLVASEERAGRGSGHSPGWVQAAACVQLQGRLVHLAWVWWGSQLRGSGARKLPQKVQAL